MRRWSIILLGALAVVAVDAQSSWAAASPWPPIAPEFLKRGPSFYLSDWKVFLSWALFAVWVKTADWISQDCLDQKHNYVLWNGVAVGSFVASFILLWLLPWFLLSYFLMLAALVAPMAVYVRFRNKPLPAHEQVLTPQHIRRWFSESVSRVGVKVAAEKKAAHEIGPDLQLKARGAKTDVDNNVNLLTARQSPGYLTARKLLHDAIEHRAEGIVLDYNQQAVAVSYQIDGVMHGSAPQEREQADPMLEVLKLVSALNPKDRRARQSGSFGVETPASKFGCKITSQGTQTGERVVMQIEMKKAKLDSLDDVGMRPKMQEQLTEILAQKAGFFLAASLPVGGLTTTFDAVLKTTDRYTRNFAEVEEKTKLGHELENVPATTYDAAAGETPDTILPKLIRTYPDVFVVRDLVNGETVKILCQQVTGEGRLVLGTIRAKEAVEALLRVLLMKVPAAEFAPAVTAVLNVRLIRKLCDKCKEAYPPPAELLKQLGVPAGKIEAFYRVPTPPPPDAKDKPEICKQCQGIGYYGRTAFFELLTVDDRLRELLVSSPKLDVLRAAARQARHRGLQDEGLLLVAKGITSVQELSRVLKA